MTEKERPLVIALMGPTASGKTQLAIDLAKTLNGEVISVDSALVYRGMNIGTAKPTFAERQGVPHHLIDILDPAEAYSTGQFLLLARSLIGEIISRGRLPILVGGTMLYFNALWHGLATLPVASEAIRQQIDDEAVLKGWPALHIELQMVDPVAADRIHPNDPQRIQRALEVYRISGVPLSTLIAESRQAALPCEFIRLILAPHDREWIHRRIENRFRNMLDDGFLDEVRILYSRGDLDTTMPAIRAVGYRQAWAFLEAECSFEEMTERAVIATRQFAKRQMTWLRRETSALWFNSGDQDLFDKVMLELRQRL